MKEVKDFKILDSTAKDIAIAFWYTDGTKEIVVMTKVAAAELLKLGKELKDEKQTD